LQLSKDAPSRRDVDLTKDLEGTSEQALENPDVPGASYRSRPTTATISS
jgi:hypothetical protein